MNEFSRTVLGIWGWVLCSLSAFLVLVTFLGGAGVMVVMFAAGAAMIYKSRQED